MKIGNLVLSDGLPFTAMKLFLFLFALLATASGLRIFVGTARATTARACAANMALPKIDDARSLSTEEIEAEIATAKKVRDRALSRGGAINPFFISPRSVLTALALSLFNRSCLSCGKR